MFSQAEFLTAVMAEDTSTKVSFSSDWWSNNIPTWLSQFPFVGSSSAPPPPLRMLEIGSFEGRSATWFLDHLLTHEASHLTCVDTFQGSHEHRSRDLDLLETRCRSNLARFGPKVTVIQGSSFEILRSCMRAPQYDIIYIDGEHHAASALEDAVLAFPLLKTGGRMVIDDYGATCAVGAETSLPRLGVDAFLTVFRDRVRIDGVGWQLFLTKLSQTCNEPKCACDKHV